MVRAESVAELFTSTRWTFDITRINLIPMNKMKYRQDCLSKGFKGFTLVELLVVIAIIAVLAVLSFFGASRFIENGRKVQALAQFRDFEVGMTMYVADYQKPPTPPAEKASGKDTLYGNPNPRYHNSFLISVLSGDGQDYPSGSETLSSKLANPRGETYIIFPTAVDQKTPKKGVGKDGILYDPWGKEVMVAVNSYNAPDQPLDDSEAGTGGVNDNMLDTYGFGEYKETKPKKQAYVFWSYGKDGKKGNGKPNTPYAGTDDVISW